MPDVAQFVPPGFEPVEFDDRLPTRSAPGATRRWFSHWNGLIGQPAQEVALGFSDGSVTVLVCTSGDAYDRPTARYRLAHLALGGTELGVAPPDLPSGSVPALLEGIAADDRSWSGGGDGELLAHAWFTGWYGRRPGVTVFVVSDGRLDGPPAVREVTDWTDYDVDASAPFPLGALHR